MGDIQISQVAQKILNLYNDCILDNNNTTTTITTTTTKTKKKEEALYLQLV